MRFLILFLLLLGVSPVLAQNTISLLAITTGPVGQNTPTDRSGGYPMSAVGTYKGTTPTSVTGTWTGCGGGAATIWNPFAAQGYGFNGPAFITGQYPVTTFPGQDGTFALGVTVPATAGTGCTLTITDNRSVSSTSPPTTVYNYPSGSEIQYNVHNAPGWIHSHSYAPPAATATFTNSSANIAMTNVLTAGTPVYFETSGTLPTNFSVGTTYYAIATGLSGSNVQVSATVGGSAIVAGSAGSGTQTGYAGGAHTRVNNGPGWTESTGVWNPGSVLRAYELTSGSCTSAASGGPTGTGSSISDGSCTWKYLSDTDYVSWLGWLLDAPPWTAKTYTWGQFVTVNTGGVNRAYVLADNTSNNSNPYSLCTSTVAPSGVGSGGGNGASLGQLTTSDGCVWGYWGDVQYSSQTANLAQHSGLNESQYFQGQNHVLPQSYNARAYTALLWNDREYLAGSNGELAPFQVSFHLSRWGGGGGETTWWDCVGPTTTTDCQWMTVKAAPGEGFANGFTPSTPLTGYDPIKGVAIHNTGVVTNGGTPIAVVVSDFNIIVQGLQIKSDKSDALYGAFQNYAIFMDNIVDGGYSTEQFSARAPISGDVPNIFVNNLIISHGWWGIWFKYGSGVALFNTIINEGSATNSTCMNYAWAWVWVSFIAANNACYNFAHSGSYYTVEGSGNNYIGGFNSSSANNVTNTPVGADYGNVATLTFSNGSPNIGWPSNTLVAGQPVQLGNSGGSLPTNFSISTKYYVIATGLSSSNVQLSATVGGSAISAGSAGSGTQTGWGSALLTDVGSGDSVFITPMPMPNSTYGATGASMFVNPGSDWRPGPALKGAGASYGTFNWGCSVSGEPSCVNQPYNYDTPDFIGTARPQAGSWTAGVEQALSGAASFLRLHLGLGHTW